MNNKIDDGMAKIWAFLKWLKDPDGSIFFWVERRGVLYQMAYIKTGWVNVKHYRNGGPVSWASWWATLLF